MKVRHIDRGINPPSVKQIYFSGEYLGKGFKIGIVAAMIALTVRQNTKPLKKKTQLDFDVEEFIILKTFLYYQEAIAIGRTFASMKDYQLDGNKEMVALGAMNIVGSMTSCYVATGKRITTVNSTTISPFSLSLSFHYGYSWNLPRKTRRRKKTPNIFLVFIGWSKIRGRLAKPKKTKKKGKRKALKYYCIDQMESPQGI